MMRNLWLVFVMLLLLPAGAAPARKRSVKIEVVKVERSATANPTDDLIELKVRLTNQGSQAVPYTNNRFVLEDSLGKKHLVSRPWYPQGDLLEPGKSVEFDRVYFEIPKAAKRLMATKSGSSGARSR